MGIDFSKIKLKKLTEEQIYLAATYRAILRDESRDLFQLKRQFTEREINEAIRLALVAKDIRRNKQPKSIMNVDCDTVIIHGVHQFTPTILSMIEAIEKYKRVVLLFNYQEQYKEIYQTWLDVYSCFDINIKSQFNNEFQPSKLLQASYCGNRLADKLAKLADGEFDGQEKILEEVSVIEFDNITEFSAYVARIYEAALEKVDDENNTGSALLYMSEQFYAANNSVNDILKVYFPNQFGERHFLAYPIGHFFVAVTNMWDAENGGIRIENMNDLAECLCSEALPENKVGSLITTFNATKNYFSRATCLLGTDEQDGIIDLLKKLKKQKRKLVNGKLEFSEQLGRLNYYNVPIEDLEELISALETLDSITNYK